MALHKESLLRLDLVRQMLAAPTRKVARGIDAWWSYQKAIPISVGGFNPCAASIFYPQSSCFARWLEHPEASARDYNLGDFLMKEVLFAVHDYLHDWGYRAIAALRPELGLGTAEITPDNLEALTFGHLVTEAIATVGLDYWYLSTFRLSDLVPIGSARQTLSVSYHEDDRAEYRRFNPKLRVQSRGFFAELARFYCSGVFHGFDPRDLERSPKIFRWLRHELTYGHTQRGYFRLWLGYLSGGRVRLDATQAYAPFTAEAPWQARLIGQLGELLWHKVKHPGGADDFPALDPARCWRSPARGPIDFRFVNLNALAPAEAARARPAPGSFAHFSYQLLSTCDYRAFEHARLARFEEAVRAGDLGTVRRLVAGMPRLSPVAGELRDLMILN